MAWTAGQTAAPADATVFFLMFRGNARLVASFFSFLSVWYLFLPSIMLDFLHLRFLSRCVSSPCPGIGPMRISISEKIRKLSSDRRTFEKQFHKQRFLVYLPKENYERIVESSRKLERLSRARRFSSIFASSQSLLILKSQRNVFFLRVSIEILKFMRYQYESLSFIIVDIFHPRVSSQHPKASTAHLNFWNKVYFLMRHIAHRSINHDLSRIFNSTAHRHTPYRSVYPTLCFPHLSLSLSFVSFLCSAIGLTWAGRRTNLCKVSSRSSPEPKKRASTRIDIAYRFTCMYVYAMCTRARICMCVRVRLGIGFQLLISEDVKEQNM